VLAAVETLESLRREGVIDAVQYLERMPDRLIPGKAELIAELKAKLGSNETEKEKGEAYGL
jgi:hypothetical protein